MTFLKAAIPLSKSSFECEAEGMTLILAVPFGTIGNLIGASCIASRYNKLMTILFLAGGEGKRMWPINTDKPLIEFLGKPLAWYNLKKINESVKPDNFIIVTAPQNQEVFSDIALSLHLKAKIAVQKQPKGMADAVLSVLHFLSGECLIVNAEDLLDASAYADVVRAAKDESADAVFAALKTEKYFPGGYIEISNSKNQISKIRRIVEKPGEGKEPSDMVKLVVDYFKDVSQLISYLKKTQSEKDDVYEVALNQMIEDGVEVKFVKYEGIWQALKYPWHILDYMEYFLKGLPEKDNVILEEGVKVYEGAIIKGPAYIGRGSIIGANSLVRESIIGSNCVIGYSTEVARSYVGPDCWFHTNYVGDSILEGDFGAGSGTVLANLRLDNQNVRVGEKRIETYRQKLGLIAGKGVRVGVNASTMPGVRTGANSLIGPGVTLTRDVEENTKVTLKSDYVLEENRTVTGYSQFRDKLK